MVLRLAARADAASTRSRARTGPNSPGSPTEAEADLALDQDGERATTTVGDEIMYTIKVSNGGPAEAANRRRRPTRCPPNVTLVSATATAGQLLGQLDRDLHARVTLANGASATRHDHGESRARPGMATNTATVKATAADSNSANDSASATTAIPPASPRRRRRTLAQVAGPSGKLRVATARWVSTPLENLNPTLVLSGTAQLVTYGRGAATGARDQHRVPGGWRDEDPVPELKSARCRTARADTSSRCRPLLTLHDEFGRER